MLAGEAEIVCKRILPSDLTSMWLGEGTAKIRELFEWALRQPSCLLVVDELDAIAPQRREHNMHADEKRQVNELLAQLDRIAGKPVVVVGTTNYVRGIDVAIRRSGRFDVKIPVFPPSEADRKAIFDYYLGPRSLRRVAGVEAIDTGVLAREAVLFTPADIKSIVDGAVRGAIFRAQDNGEPRISQADIGGEIRRHTRTIGRRTALKWIKEAREELGDSDELRWLREECDRAFEKAVS